jgi:Cdc6-like AAA superfamily ATPase
MYKNIDYKKGIYIYGSSGVGKTTFVLNILKKLNYDIIHYDAGDVRNKALIENIASNNISTCNVLDMMHKRVKKIAILMDEIDGLSEDKIVNVLTAYLDGKTYTDGGKVYNQDLHKLSNKKLILEVTNVIAAFAKRGFGAGVFTSVNVNDLRLVNKPASPEVIVDIGATEKEILSKIDQEIYNRLVPLDVRMIFNKQGKPIQGRGTRAATGLFKFKRD